MKRFMLTVFVSMLMGFGAIAETESEEELWFQDAEKAMKEAREREAPVLINFSGSDWCGWCIKLEEEVFSKSEFRKFARENLVLLLADFPMKKEQSKDLKQQNRKLLEKYGVRGFPTIVIVNRKGDLLARTGYRPGGAEKYVGHVKELLQKELPQKEPLQEEKK